MVSGRFERDHMSDKKFIRDTTESGDPYSATAEKWAEYWQAWSDGDMDRVMHFETGMDDDFYYNPEKEG